MRTTRLSERLIGLVILMLAASACGGPTSDALGNASIDFQDGEVSAETAAESLTDGPTDELEGSQPQAPVGEDVPLDIIEQGFGQEGQSAIYAFKVQNPDEAIGFENVGYQVAVRDSDGEIIGTDLGFITTLLPDQVLGLAGMLFLEEGQLISELEVQLSSGEEIAAEPLENFTVDNVQYLPGDLSNQVTGVVTSHFGRPYNDVRVSAITYDENGMINGGGFTFADLIPADDSVGVDVPVTSSGEVARVELYPVVSILSLSDSDADIPPDAQSLELVDFGFGANDVGASYGLLVHNPNEDFSLEGSTYTVTAFDQAGTVVATDSEDIAVILPGEELGIGGSLFVESGVPIANIEVHIRDGSFIVTDVTTGFTAEDVAFGYGDYALEVVGTIVNPNPAEATNVRVNALVFDGAGKIVGGGFNILGSIPIEGTSPIFVDVSTAATPASAKLYATPLSQSECLE